jgi:hypothetical protein
VAASVGTIVVFDGHSVQEHMFYARVDKRRRRRSHREREREKIKR